MEEVTQHSIVRAGEEATKLWAFSSAQFPINQRLIQLITTGIMLEAITTFAVNARRAMEMLPGSKQFSLRQPRWDWEPTKMNEVVHDLWDALSRIIHAKELQIGYEKLPPKALSIESGSIVIPYVQARTDRKELSFIDPFALAHAFLYDVLPLFVTEGKYPPQVHVD